MRTSLRARAFLWALALLAILSFTAWVRAWGGAVGSSIPLDVALLTLGVLALQLPLSFTPRHKVSLVPAVTFATVLLTPPPLAVVVVAMGQLIGGLTSLLRRRRSLRGRVWRPAEIIFGAARWTVAAAAGALAYYLLTPQVSPFPAAEPWNLVALPLAAITMNMVDTWSVAVLTGLQVRQNPALIWVNSRSTEPLQPVALYVLGLLGALISSHYHWALLVALVPAGLLYFAVRSAVTKVLFEQTVSAVEAMADIVDMRDHYTFEHSKRVTEYAVRLAHRLNLADEEIERIRLASRVHDLGKIGIPDSVLLKDGKLTEEEWATMQQHPKFGYDILGKFPEYREGKELVLYHHERFDGRGYPHGLDGTQMPLGAQIIAVADSFDAMTTDRPYRAALFLEDVMAEFARGKGSQWNPQVVGALEELAAQLGSALIAPRRPARIGLFNRELIEGGADAIQQLAGRLQLDPGSLDRVRPEVASAMLGQLDGLVARIASLERQVTIDDLTGVARREAAEAALEKEINRARRLPHGTLALGLVDITGLRELNESAGQAAGDRLLQALADALRHGVRSYDVVARWGDDEFMVIIPECDERDATRLLSQLATAFELRTGWSVTVGLSALRAEDRAQDLITRAELERRRQPRPRGVQTPRALRALPPLAGNEQGR